MSKEQTDNQRVTEVPAKPREIAGLIAKVKEAKAKLKEAKAQAAAMKESVKAAKKEVKSFKKQAKKAGKAEKELLKRLAKSKADAAPVITPDVAASAV